VREFLKKNKIPLLDKACPVFSGGGVRGGFEAPSLKERGIGGEETKIISKIENQEGLDHLDEIVEASDMVMIARGDLGTEIPLEDIPEIQMNVIKTCQLKNTPVIVATQMMASMVENPTPTRAEVSDVFLAVREGADYLMLSEETTIGHYPIQTVEIMQKIIQEAKNS
jgi:pyruvate kinase